MTRQLTTGLEVDVPTYNALAQELAVLEGHLTRHVDTGVNRPGVPELRALTGSGQGQVESPEPLHSRTALFANLAPLSQCSLSGSAEGEVGGEAGALLSGTPELAFPRPSTWACSAEGKW